MFTSLFAVFVVFVVLFAPAQGVDGPVPLKICIISGSWEYDSEQSLTAFAAFIEQHDPASCVLVQAEEVDSLPGLETPGDCDVALLFTRRLTIDGEQLDRIEACVESGKPVVGVRTASHGFQNWLEMDATIFGGKNRGHFQNDLTTEVAVDPGAGDHPIVAQVSPYESKGSRYKVLPLADDCRILLVGTSPEAEEPLAWTRARQWPLLGRGSGAIEALIVTRSLPDAGGHAVKSDMIRSESGRARHASGSGPGVDQDFGRERAMTTRNRIGRWTFPLLVVGAAVAGSGQANAQEVSAALRDRVAQLVERLEQGEADAKDEAEQALAKLGDRILTLLPEPEEVEDADLKERIARIRTALEGEAAEGSFEASRVTIKAEGIRLSEALRELQRQSGNQITDLRELYGQDATNPGLDLDLDNLPFLEAFDRVAAEAGLTPVYFTGDGTIGLLTGGQMEYGPEAGGGSAPVQYTGPFRVSLNQIAAQHDLSTGARSANAQLTVVWEPRLRPMLMSLDVSNIEIIDDRGEKVEPSVPDESGTVVLRPETPFAELNLNMNSPAREAQTLDLIKLRATITVPAANEVFRLDLAKPNTSQERGDLTLAIGQVNVDGFVWKVDVRLTYDGQSEAFETYRQGLFNNRIWLQRPDGSRFDQNGGFNQIGASSNAMAFQYLFVDAPGEPSDYQLVYETPGSVAEIPLEIEFKDVPLP